MAAVDPGLAILGLPGSRLLELAEQRGLRVIREAFADRGYTPSATLVSRREPGAVLHDPDTVAERVLRMVSDGLVEAVDGSTVKLDVDSVCVHGDSPAAIEMARAVRDILGANDVEIKPFS